MNNAENDQYVDALVLQALRQNDEKALQYLFTTYYNPLFRAGIKWSFDSTLTEEAIQAIFQDLWQYRHTLGDVVSFEAYLKGSLKKRLVKALAKLQQTATEPLDEVYLPVTSYEDILVAQEEDAIRRSQLVQAMNELTSRQKQIITLKYFEELSYKEISEQTGLQIDSIYKTLHEALKRLKTLLKPI
ncbi:RNA polymerase sigma factor [Spirosoma endbachense]|uniref:Sigma-70 family RNA polymerase sigma factor n=1 Tax=Spirosoma endbachense TaxID=2666025 RepID=A0A6P1VYI4_9BACT|nr:sigma-70 family RNA polymerase sigma factor [Spirosoma endbachense]QHV98271.1 sigma-70 family RNA polymerase sigma factor [Spirosoma endbachense]